MPVEERTYERLALEDPEGLWELHDGQLVQKPAMTTRHNHIARVLAFRLQSQLDLSMYEVAINNPRTRRARSSYYIPDLVVIPVSDMRDAMERRPKGPEAYTRPLPLVVEVWSPSTGRYDPRTKLPEYHARGDAEIWYIHPYERTLTAWRRQPDGSYTQLVFQGGVVEPVSLPGVTINLDELFET
jgi:Uma2 family endonuclease